jgi:LuxR family maltose regulon positive regulatory protein
VLRQVKAYPDARLILVSAPAGFGKSTSLLQWARRRQEEGSLVAWYAVDERDNDPTRFAAYLLGAFGVAGVQLPVPDSDERIEVQETVTSLLNAAAQVEKRVLLLLDDYHLISEPQVHDAIRRLCEYMPANMRLAIGTRVDPPLPLARMRSRGEIAEVRMADLRFNAEEVREWCDTSLGWRPSRSSVEGLERTTEGWAAALALIMMSRPTADEQGLEQQLARYSQSQRHIFDYFAQEILEHQPEQIRQFLLDTSVLDELSPDLCTTLTGDRQAPLLLNQLAAESLFVIPLSDTEPVYRYHHLFSQFLRQNLVLKHKERYLEQHRRAAQWYAGQNSFVEAVDHALAAEDLDHAADLIQEKAYVPLMSHGAFMTLVNWLPHFSTEVLARHPRLWLDFVRALYLSGHVELAESHIRRSEEVLDWGSTDESAQRALQAMACNFRATLAAYRGELRQARRWIEEAQALTEWVDERERVRIASSGAFIRYLMDDVPGARHAYLQTLAMAEQVGARWIILDTHYYLAQLDLLSCNLEAAQARCERLLDAYPARIAMRTPLMLPLAQALYQRDQPVAAEMLLREALARAQNSGQPDTCFFAHIALSAMLVARGEIAEAQESISQAGTFAEHYKGRMADALLKAAEARVMLQSDRLAEAAVWAEQYVQMETADYHDEFEKLTVARVWLAQGKYEQSLGLLAEIVNSAQAKGRILYVLHAEIARALVFQDADKPELALSALDRALGLAEGQRFVRVFLDMGRPMRALLRRAVARQPVSEYAQFLLDRTSQADATLHPADQLTERETEVLEQVATGASNQEIAETLLISVGTVKSHIHHIMSKLDAQNRTEAVSKARTFKILPD